ncbi:type II toxin-antitoxin system RelE/ParE family toxin [Embleya sp. NBC_00896]|uniref:type II toxin-antitoxin system RelE/ParE family toxin n=1 Tax=Embleya sp. NBC_00896 TaxID=2975961 RepID=UPI00386DAC1B|nr:type II toxin-antitoxin system RelE/ParE family toxin [Embleya sp. NBC_00896]WSY13175.1 type II toxin-antitoxin system RelE/ParE family toxin [Embleya sp. NBC_00896]WSY13184.1 type II toxin-antitoxin system RelE/ParE family toxin [Embleya sp. NBC_00896]
MSGVFAIEMEPEVRAWLEGLSAAQRGTVKRFVERLANEGERMGMPRSKPLGQGLFELRFDLANRAMRITYWIRTDATAVLLTVFRKQRMNEHVQVERARQVMKTCQNDHSGAPVAIIFAGEPLELGGW